jgi:DNA replication protein DnaC
MSPTTDAVKEISFMAREMRLPVVGQVASGLADQARDEGWSHEEYLAAVLSRQLDSRRARGERDRIGGAHFPQVKTLEDFDMTCLKTIPKDLIAHLATSTFIPKADNVILLGPPGIGKTHLAIGLGHKACQHGYRVIFETATGWISRLAEAHAHGNLDSELKRLDRFKLLICDELGYLPFDPAAASLLFQLVAYRYERASIIITSNLPFSRWGETLSDETIAAATIDRLVHHAHVIALDGQSYRTRNHRHHPKEQTTHQP